VAEFREVVPEEKISAVAGVKSVFQSGNFWEIVSNVDNDIRPAIFEFAVKNKFTLLTLQEKQQNLENVFHQLTQKK
jgi:ABC-2 type transport system ATP-binding protein